MRCVTLKDRMSKGETRDSQDIDLKMGFDSGFGSALRVLGRGGKEGACGRPGEPGMIRDLRFPILQVLSDLAHIDSTHDPKAKKLQKEKRRKKRKFHHGSHAIRSWVACGETLPAPGRVHC